MSGRGDGRHGHSVADRTASDTPGSLGGAGSHNRVADPATGRRSTADRGGEEDRQPSGRYGLRTQVEAGADEHVDVIRHVVLDQHVGVTGVAVDVDNLAGCETDPRHPVGDVVERRHRHRARSTTACAGPRSSCSRTPSVRSNDERRGVDRGGQRRQDDAHDDEGRPRAEVVEQDSSANCACREAGLEHRFDDTEDPGEHAVGDESLQHAVVADVDDAVADADDPEQQQRRNWRRNEGADREWGAPGGETHRERTVQADTIHHDHGEWQTDEPTHSHRAIQTAPAEIPGAHHVDGEHDDDHAHRTADERLRGAQQRHQSGATVGGQLTGARRVLGDAVRAVGVSGRPFRGGSDREPAGDQSGRQHRAAGRDQQRRDTEHHPDDAAEHRTEERAGAVEEPGGRVGRQQFRRRSNQGGRRHADHRAEAAQRDADDAGPGEHADRRATRTATAAVANGTIKRRRPPSCGAGRRARGDTRAP